MFIQTESTPNPATLKFLPGREVMGEGSVADFPDRSAASRSPLARALFEMPEVSRVFFGSDFISVTKTENDDWKHIKPAILGTIMEHFTRELPLMDGNADEADAEMSFGESDPATGGGCREAIAGTGSRAGISSCCTSPSLMSRMVVQGE